MEPLHHFTLAPSIILSTNLKEATELAIEMHGHDLLRLPYPKVALSFGIADMMLNPVWLGPEAVDRIPADVMAFARSASLHAVVNDVFHVGIHPVSKKTALQSSMDQYLHLTSTTGSEEVIDLSERSMSRGIRNYTYMVTMATLLLVISLRTKNVVVDTKVNKRAHRGVGNGPFRGMVNGTVYISTTMVSPPSFGADASGKLMPPHLRRGHEHTFLVGKGRTEKIKKFIDPIFVNGRDYDKPLPPREYVVT